MRPFTSHDASILQSINDYDATSAQKPDIEIEKVILSSLKLKTDPSVYSRAIDVFKDSRTRIHLGTKLQDEINFSIQTRNELRFNELLEVNDRYLRNLEAGSKCTVLRHRREFFVGLMDVLKDPEALKMIKGRYAIAPEAALSLLRTTQGIDELVIEAMDIRGGLHYPIATVRVDDPGNARQALVYDVSPVFSVLALLLQKDKEGSIFKNTLKSLIHCKDIIYSDFSLKSLLMLQEGQNILSAMHNASSHSAVLEVIVAQEDSLLDTFARKKGVASGCGTIMSNTYNLKPPSLSFDLLKGLYDAGAKRLAKSHVRNSFFTPSDVEPLAEIKTWFQEIPKDDYLGILLTNLEYHSSRSAEKKENIYFKPLLDYAVEHDMSFQGNTFSYHAESYFKLLADYYSGALANEDKKAASWTENRFSDDFNALPDNDARIVAHRLTDRIPSALINCNSRFKKLLLSSDMEL